MNYEIPEKEHPETTEEQCEDLWDTLMQFIIDYLNSHDIKEIDAIYFSADGLKNSLEDGRWSSDTDSSIKLEDWDDDKGRSLIYRGI